MQLQVHREFKQSPPLPGLSSSHRRAQMFLSQKLIKYYKATNVCLHCRHYHQFDHLPFRIYQDPRSQQTQSQIAPPFASKLHFFKLNLYFTRLRSKIHHFQSSWLIQLEKWFQIGLSSPTKDPFNALLPSTSLTSDFVILKESFLQILQKTSSLMLDEILPSNVLCVSLGRC